MHAFSLNFPPLEFLDLSKEVVSLSGHLPLYLEIAGSYLSRKSIRDWTTYMIELGKVPEEKVQERLMISYNTLGNRSKQVFLDIACFFVNKEKSDAIYMWEACGFHPDSGLKELTSKSMVKVINGSKLWMHDFMRDLGREIVCQENLIDPGERSRLWIHEEALGILERKEGTRKVQALCFSADEQSKCFTRENFKKLMNLRFLEWSGPYVLEGTFEHLLSKLRWLSWHNCPSSLGVQMLNLANLVILDLSGSNISEDWEGWSQTNMGCNLKVLNLMNCVYLTKTPNLSKLTGLERLILSGCTQLTEIDRSIGMVKRLKHLNLKRCCSLRGLPEVLCCLDGLEEILIVGGGKAHSFSLPQSIGNLVRMTVLDIRNLRVPELPESICKLKKLKRLVLNGCLGISKFPKSFGDLESLVTLEAAHCEDLCELPDSTGNLKQLKVIELQGTQIIQLPSTIGMLEQLEELNVNSAYKLTVAPPDIDRLLRLRNLDLSGTSIKVLPSLSKLPHLQSLLFSPCNLLLQVPELPTSLQNLEVWSDSVQKVSSDFSLLKSLVKLVWACRKVGWPPAWGKQGSALSSLSLGVLNLTDNNIESDVSTMLNNCLVPKVGWPLGKAPALTDVLSSTSNIPRLSTLKNLTSSIPRLSTLKNLSYLKLWSCKFGDWFHCLDIAGMKSLRDLEVLGCDCENLYQDLLPENLERLMVFNCDLLTKLDVSKLRKLKSLSITGCELLKHIQGLADLKSVKVERGLTCHTYRTHTSFLGKSKKKKEWRLLEC